jgi:Domain of unknown function (DUF4145)
LGYFVLFGRSEQLTMDRKIYKLPFTKGNAPDWACPSCAKGVLNLDPPTFHHQEIYSSRDHSHDEWEPEWITYCYSRVLVCSNAKCKETVASVGTGEVDWYPSEDEHGYPIQEYDDYFRPKYFIPHLKFFPIPANAPATARELLMKSFDLFFADPNAALNQVRAAFEEVLTHLGIKRFNRVNGRLQFISLHNRITLLPSKFQKLKDMMVAVKWLGNAGSHAGKTTTIDDVLDAYELTIFILDQIYNDKSLELNKIVKRVNKKKGP